MIPELGHFALILALVAALIQGILPLFGTQMGIRSWVNTARPAAFANALFCTMAFVCLAYCFITSDFSVMNVAQNSNTMLPWFYRFAATWGSHEGSILFWTLLLALWAFAHCHYFQAPSAGGGCTCNRRDGSDFRRSDTVHVDDQ